MASHVYHDLDRSEVVDDYVRHPEHHSRRPVCLDCSNVDLEQLHPQRRRVVQYLDRPHESRPRLLGQGYVLGYRNASLVRENYKPRSIGTLVPAATILITGKRGSGTYNQCNIRYLKRLAPGQAMNSVFDCVNNIAVPFNFTTTHIPNRGQEVGPPGRQRDFTRSPKRFLIPSVKANREQRWITFGCEITAFSRRWTSDDLDKKIVER
ncbi:hypothetical protein T265_02541 [Opisthorchis viverrini]|uniref:Uncharacterized protein n=1 Tax=Opisthorchis viverrini TaxID=6198 RepID=A0A075A6H3_OPIVI|nr:hypothetical protein T265_02541 [Opisthorchis viverrini]KER31225.1 hypothetical protein T265_02541 [Opisthorchis viverrini]